MYRYRTRWDRCRLTRHQCPLSATLSLLLYSLGLRGVVKNSHLISCTDNVRRSVWMSRNGYDLLPQRYCC